MYTLYRRHKFIIFVLIFQRLWWRLPNIIRQGISPKILKLCFKKWLNIILKYYMFFCWRVSAPYCIVVIQKWYDLWGVRKIWMVSTPYSGDTELVWCEEWVSHCGLAQPSGDIEVVWWEGWKSYRWLAHSSGEIEVVWWEGWTCHGWLAHSTVVVIRKWYGVGGENVPWMVSPT